MNPSRRHHLRVAAVTLVGAAGAAVGFSLATAGPSDAFGVPLPYYTIEATSGSHHASLLNLPIGLVGVPQVPVPVDVDGDLLPDVTVAVNLVDPQGALQNPPDPADVVPVPNVEINRILTAPVLAQPSPPLHIQVGITVVDTGGGDNTVLQFGYDTGPGGSIPTRWKALLGGIENLYNPLEAVVDSGPSTGSPATYEGPLRITGSIESGESVTDLGFHYRPFPNRVHVIYESDDAGQHIDYDHQASREIDLDTAVDVVGGGDELHVDARVDRLPASLRVDLGPGGEDGGSVAYEADTDGRRPDVDIHVESSSAGGDPLVADVDLESLPSRMAAAWSLPDDGPVDVAFDGEGPGLGAVDVDIRNYTGDSPFLTDFIPTEQQFLSLQQAGDDADHPHRRISGRVERVRHVGFTNAGRSLGVSAQLGDGALPLEVQYECTAACDEAGDIARLSAHAVAAPLPDDLTFTLDRPGENQTAEPLAVTYDASQVADLDVQLRINETGFYEESACGAVGTVCADLELRNLPTHMSAQVARSEDDDEGEVLVDFDTSGGSLEPDIGATVTLGPDEPGEKPFVATGNMWGLPEHARMRLHQRLDADTGQLAIDRVQFFACAVDFAEPDPGCPDGPATEIGGVELAMRTFTTRPPGFPITVTPEPLHATVTGREDETELAVRFTRISEVQYLNTGGLLGVRAAAGDGTEPFAARIDMADVPLGDGYELSDEITLQDATRDVFAEAVVTDLPATFDVCFRSANEELDDAGTAFTAPCVEESPFDPEVEPLAVAYRLAPDAQDRAVSGTFESTTRGMRLGFPNLVPYSETVRGHASAPSIPTELTAFVRMPPDGAEGPIQARYTSDGQVDLTFRGEKRVNDAQCLDPRVAARALCVAGTLENIPTAASLDFDPTAAVDNLSVTTGNQNIVAPPVNLTGLEVSSIAPNPDVPGTASVLILDGEVLGLPTAVTGTVDMPDERPDGPDPDTDPDAAPASLEVEATNDGASIASIDLTARNFVTPDPTPSAIPDRDTAFDPPTDVVSLFQRGEAFRASLQLDDLSAIGYRTSRDAEGNKLDAQQFTIGVAPDQGEVPIIRVYADLDAGTSMTRADVTLADIPERTTLCFRGRLIGSGDAVDPTFCDEAEPDEGAFELLTVPRPGAGELDVDGYFRQAEAGGQDVLAARIGMTDVPRIVQGTFPAAEGGDIDVGGFRRSLVDPSLLVPDDFGAIDVDLATFDLLVDGYGADRGFVPATNAVPPFPAPGAGQLGPQHLSVVARDDDVNAKVHIEDVERIRVVDGLCPALDRADYPYYPDPSSYPDIEKPTTYNCIRADFTGGTVDTLGLHADVGSNGQRVAITDAGLTNVPDWFQVTVADAPDTDILTGAFRPRCGTDAPGPDDGPMCTPPMMRFDSADSSSAAPVLFGRLHVGSTSDLGKLHDIEPGATVTGFDVEGVPSAEGARAKVAIFGGEGTDQPEETVAAQVGFRFELPGSLTVDRAQTWDEEVGSASGPEHEKYSDLRFHYVARDADGIPVPDLGDLQALIALGDGSQILVHDASLDDAAVVPGEFGIDLYQRDDLWEGRSFMQMEGRLSAPLSLGATIVSTDAALGFGRLDAEILHLPGVTEDTPADEPSYRFQMEMFGDGEKDADPEEDTEDSCTVFMCTESRFGIRDVNVAVDFQPPGQAEPARLVKMVQRAEGTANAMQIAGYPSVHNLNNTSTGGQDGTVPVSAYANVVIDPLYFSFDLELFVVGSIEMELDAFVEVSITASKAANFEMRQNLMKVDVHHTGTGNPIDSYSTVGPLNMYIYTLHGAAYANIFKTFGMDWAPPYPVKPEAANLGAFDCSGDFALLSESQNYVTSTDADPSGHKANLLWPLEDDRLELDGALGDLIEFLGPIIEPYFCALETNQPLVTNEAPADPLPRTDHPVPGYENATAPLPEPPPEQPNPDETQPRTIDEPTDMCGVLVHTTLTIDAPVTVATTAGPDCPAEEVGQLSIIATDVIITANGSIDANAIIHDYDDFNWPRLFERIDPSNAYQTTALLPEYNGGGGHIADGGTAWGLCDTCGLYESRGRATSEAELEVRANPGFPGGSAVSIEPTNDNGGGGGGVIIIEAETVTLDGELHADGQDGEAGEPALCSSQNGVTMGEGGGAGGGIVISALKLTAGAQAAISADGGSGGTGNYGGGAGSAGVVKLLAPVTENLDVGNQVSANHGAGGFSHCSGPVPEQDVLDAGQTALSVGPPVGSRALPNGDFWHNLDFEVDYMAAGHANATGQFKVYLCGQYLGPETTNLDFDMPAVHGPGLITAGPARTYCGEDAGADASKVLDFNFPGQHPAGIVRRSDGASLSALLMYEGPQGSLTDGYWGIWTVAVRSNVANNDCFNHIDTHPDDPQAGAFYDTANCIWEPPPLQPDVIVGVDHQPADASITPLTASIDDPNGVTVYVTNERTVPVSVFGEDTMASSVDPDNTQARVPVSGVEPPICFTDDGDVLFPCSYEDGGIAPLSGSDGVKTVGAVIADLTGQWSVPTANVLLDTTIPGATIAPSAGPDLPNGWYSVPPDLTISGFADGDAAVSSGPNPEHPYHWRIDDGSEHDCLPGAVCTIPASELPTGGHHTVWFTAEDAAGNRLANDDDEATPPMQSFTLKLDNEAPLVDVRAVPQQPDGENGWYRTRPWIGVAAFDRPVGGSGIKPAPGETPGAGIYYSVTTDDGGGPELIVDNELYTNPFQLGAGAHTVCFRGVDVAGNGTNPLIQSCVDVRVDDVRPLATLSASPAAPDGGSGWYVSEPDVSLAGFDPFITGGSGVVPAGLRLSVDGGPLVAYTSPVHLLEGEHRVLAQVTDVAGNRSTVVERIVLVDRSHPVTAARLFPAAPAWSPWYRAEPRVVLRATDGDQNGGVERIEYRVDGGSWHTYTEPFELGAGHHSVEYRAVDRSGPANAEPIHMLQTHTDVTPPTATALAADPKVWSRLLGPATTSLKWRVSDDLSGHAHVTVLVYNVLGERVRRLDAGTFDLTPGQTLNGSTPWDGKDDSLLGLVPIGIYHYRVVVTDDAGNVAQSGESKTIQIKLL